MDSHGWHSLMNVSGKSIQPLRDPQVHTNKLHQLTCMHFNWTNIVSYWKQNFVVKSLFMVSSHKDLALTAVGHNLGAEHPFYDQEIVKQGQIGGIMDYGGYLRYGSVTAITRCIWLCSHTRTQTTTNGRERSSLGLLIEIACASCWRYHNSALRVDETKSR